MKKILVILISMSVFLTMSPTTYGADSTILWTDEELEFIAAHPIITMGVDPQFVPYEFIDNDIYSGIASEYVELIEQKTGIDFQVVPDLTFIQAYYEALAGNIDVLPAVSKTPAREEFFLFSDMYYETQRVIVTRDNNTSIDNLKDLYGETVAVQEASSHQSFLSEYSEITMSTYSTVGEALVEVSAGAEFAFVGFLATSDYIAKSLGLTNLRFASIPNDQPIGLHFAVRQDWAILVIILNKCLDSITTEEKIAISSRWVTIQTETDYGPVWEIIIMVGSVVFLITAISLIWVFRLKKEMHKRKIIQIDLENAKRDADEANAVKSRFMARMSHEIRTPLNAITGMTYLMKKTGLTPTQRMYSDRITQASTTMLSLVNDILDYSKIEAGKVALEIVSFNLDHVIQNVISIISLKIEEKKLGFKLYKDSDLPSWYSGDSKRLEQVLLNLLNNAVKFTSEGEISFEIRLVAKQGNKHKMTFTIKDTGIGMSEQSLKELFVPFVQADSSINRRFGGTGLGLSIVKNLIEMMDGNIDVYSTENEGSTFVVTLELPIDAEKEDEYRKEGTANYFHSIKTLVLEKTAANLNIIESYLRSFGMSCELTTSPSAAINMLENASEPFSLFIVDFDSTPDNGFAFLTDIRDNHKILTKPKTILLLPMLRSDLFDKLDENKVDIGIGKPIIPSVLHNGIMEIFAQQTIKASESTQEDRTEKIHLTVLVVDDNTTNQMIAKLLLEQSGFDVLLAGDGKESIEVYTQHQNEIGLILMDLHMPVMNGYDAADEIRTINPNIPMVAMTAEVIPGVKEKCEAHGIHHYISKPFDPEQFVNQIIGILKSSGFTIKSDSTSINREKGLHNLGNNPEIYKMVLHQYWVENQKTGQNLELAVSEKRYEDARQIVHKIKGSTGSIGAEELYKLTISLQTALHSNDEEIIKIETTDFSSMLSRVLSEIEGLTKN